MFPIDETCETWRRSLTSTILLCCAFVSLRFYNDEFPGFEKDSRPREAALQSVYQYPFPSAQAMLGIRRIVSMVVDEFMRRRSINKEWWSFTAEKGDSWQKRVWPLPLIPPSPFISGVVSCRSRPSQGGFEEMKRTIFRIPGWIRCQEGIRTRGH